MTTTIGFLKIFRERYDLLTRVPWGQPVRNTTINRNKFFEYLFINTLREIIILLVIAVVFLCGVFIVVNIYFHLVWIKDYFFSLNSYLVSYLRLNKKSKLGALFFICYELSWIFKSFSSVNANATANASAINKTWIFKRFYDRHVAGSLNWYIKLLPDYYFILTIEIYLAKIILKIKFDYNPFCVTLVTSKAVVCYSTVSLGSVALQKCFLACKCHFYLRSNPRDLKIQLCSLFFKNCLMCYSNYKYIFS